MIYFIADEHIGHENILKLSDRNFLSLNHMKEYFIKNHNSIVKDTDTVYHLGDVGFKYYEISDYISRLKGRHVLILGNHDPNPNGLKEIFDQIHSVLMVRFNKQKFFLSHYPHLTWPSSHKGAFHLHGHCHGKLDCRLRRPGSLDVGVDSVGCFPVSIETVVVMIEIKDRLNLSY